MTHNRVAEAEASVAAIKSDFRRRGHQLPPGPRPTIRLRARNHTPLAEVAATPSSAAICRKLRTGPRGRVGPDPREKKYRALIVGALRAPRNPGAQRGRQCRRYFLAPGGANAPLLKMSEALAFGPSASSFLKKLSAVNRWSPAVQAS